MPFGAIRAEGLFFNGTLHERIQRSHPTPD
jgi:hypothetical protein